MDLLLRDASRFHPWDYSCDDVIPSMPAVFFESVLGAYVVCEQYLSEVSVLDEVLYLLQSMLVGRHVSSGVERIVCGFVPPQVVVHEDAGLRDFVEYGSVEDGSLDVSHDGVREVCAPFFDGFDELDGRSVVSSRVYEQWRAGLLLCDDGGLQGLFLGFLPGP